MTRDKKPLRKMVKIRLNQAQSNRWAAPMDCWTDGFTAICNVFRDFMGASGNKIIHVICTGIHGQGIVAGDNYGQLYD